MRKVQTMVRTADRRREQQRADSRREKSGRRVHRGALEERDVEWSQSRGRRGEAERHEDAARKDVAESAESPKSSGTAMRESTRVRGVNRSVRRLLPLAATTTSSSSDQGRPSELSCARVLTLEFSLLRLLPVCPHPRASPVGPACQYCVFDRPFHVLFSTPNGSQLHSTACGNDGPHEGG